MKTFEEAWAEYEAKGYRYGEDALGQVRFGFKIAHEALSEALADAEARGYERGKAEGAAPLETLMAHHVNETVFCFAYEGYGDPVSVWNQESGSSGEGPSVSDAARDLCAKLGLEVKPHG